MLIAPLNKSAIAGGKDSTDRELEDKIFPAVKLGGYLPTIDHLVHPQISWKDFVYYREKLNHFIDNL